MKHGPRCYKYTPAFLGRYKSHITDQTIIKPPVLLASSRGPRQKSNHSHGGCREPPIKSEQSIGT